MKAFEKWYDSNATSCDPRTANEEGWKAALKWTLEQETWIGSGDDGEWGIDKDKIKEELNAKT